MSFQEGQPETIDDSHAAPLDPTNKPSSTSNKSKWQPLASADPNPVSEHDPFSLGDSDDEEPKMKEAKADEIKADVDGSKKVESVGESLTKPTSTGVATGSGGTVPKAD